MDIKNIKKDLRRVSNINSLLMLIFFALVFGISLLILPVSRLFADVDTEIFYSVEMLVSYVLQDVVCIGGTVLVYRLTKQGRKSAENYRLFSKPKVSAKWVVRHIFIGMFFTYGTAFLSNILFSIIQMIFGIEMYAVDFTAENNAVSIFTNIFAMMFLAPFFEEVFFRGTVLRNVSKYGTWSAIVASGIFFGLWHMNYQQTIFASVMGIYAGFMTYKSKSLIPSMTLHFCINTIGAVQSIAMAGLDLEKPVSENTADNIAYMTSYMIMHVEQIAVMAFLEVLVIGCVVTGLVLFILEIKKHRESYKLEPIVPENLENSGESAEKLSEVQKTGVYFSAPVTIFVIIMLIGLTVIRAMGLF